jgi:hypothetical protein
MTPRIRPPSHSRSTMPPASAGRDHAASHNHMAWLEYVLGRTARRSSSKSRATNADIGKGWAGLNTGPCSSTPTLPPRPCEPIRATRRCAAACGCRSDPMESHRWPTVRYEGLGPRLRTGDIFLFHGASRRSRINRDGPRKRVLAHRDDRPAPGRHPAFVALAPRVIPAYARVAVSRALVPQSSLPLWPGPVAAWRSTIRATPARDADRSPSAKL